jgi:hypothetical protein
MTMKGMGLENWCVDRIHRLELKDTKVSDER